ncbi:MAG: hypothetical protein KatS3mg096_022 [Candidatus Parcubacteria bacterium]|nr:MAG: hypothetical protein KatS3mg096_022 [Candidatus Parcubacteria bacterium]
MDKEQLNTFILLLQNVRKQPSRIFDLGLIVKEPGSELQADEIFNEVRKIVDIEQIIYDETAIDEKVFEKIIKAFEGNKWIFLEIKKDISSPLLNQLKHLANYNSFQLLDYRGKDVFETKMPESSRVIVFAERDFIENKITYPHFYTLFGPVLSLE